MATQMEIAKTRPLTLADAVEEAITQLACQIHVYATMLGPDRANETPLLHSWRRDLFEIRGNIREILEAAPAPAAPAPGAGGGE